MRVQFLQLLPHVLLNVLNAKNKDGTVAVAPDRVSILVRKSSSVVIINPQSVWLMIMNSSVSNK